MQYHLGALRNVNSRIYRAIGPNVGVDSFRDGAIAEPLSRLLDEMDQVQQLPKTILYGLNSKDNEVLAAIAGNFQEGGIPSKIQFGSAWWFNDHIDGMVAQMKVLGNLGLLSRFVGMLKTPEASYPTVAMSTSEEYYVICLANGLKMVNIPMISNGWVKSLKIYPIIMRKDTLSSISNNHECH